MYSTEVAYKLLTVIMYVILKKYRPRQGSSARLFKTEVEMGCLSMSRRHRGQKIYIYIFFTLSQTIILTLIIRSECLNLTLNLEH